ncbi:ABC transporter permease [Ruminiclostridium herbifermentans]|nr:ABC transporter permease [Ruminiclostridium herbifermentans]
MGIKKLQKYSIKKLIILMSSLFFMVISINSISLNIRYTYKNDYASRMEINLRGNYVNQNNLIKASDIEDLAKSFPNGSISYMTQSDSIIEANHAIFPIKAVLSAENADKFLGLDILRGCFINSEQYQYGNKVAVISDTIAYKLFMSHNVIGNEIYISDIKYKIIGVYKSKNSILSVLASDGIERVYIPFKSTTDNASKIPYTIFIKDESLKEKPFRVHTLEGIIKERLRKEPNMYRINDFYESSIYTSQPFLLFIFLVGVLLICKVIKYFIKYLKFGFLNLKSGLRNNYLVGILFKWKLPIIIYIIGTALILILLGEIGKNITFKGAIPPEYIPVDNIFDFKFYANKIREAIYGLNSNFGYIPTQLELFLRYNLLVVYISILFLILNFIAVLSAIKLDKLVSGTITKQMAALAASVVIGLAISFIACLLFGISYIIPIKEMLILIVFLDVTFINENNVDALSDKLYARLNG